MTDLNAVSPAERITELNAIDQDIVRLLHAAGHAIRALTPSTPTGEKKDDDDDDDDDITTSSRRAVFAASAADYFRLLDAIRARLRRQIYALEEADIISADVDSVTSAPLATSADVGWLNSRRDLVGQTMESEQWAHARALLDRLRSILTPDSTISGHRRLGGGG